MTPDDTAELLTLLGAAGPPSSPPWTGVPAQPEPSDFDAGIRQVIELIWQIAEPLGPHRFRRLLARARPWLRALLTENLA